MRALGYRKRFVEDHAAGHERVAERWKEIALQVARDDDEVEALHGQRHACEVGTPAMDRQALVSRCTHGIAHSVVTDIHAECLEPRTRHRQRVPSAARGNVERPWPPFVVRRSPRESRGPFRHERGR